jgi:hypothetical protein
MCVVNFHRLYKNIKSGDTSESNKAELDALEICRFSDMLCRSLRKRSRPVGSNTCTVLCRTGRGPQAGPHLR